MIYFIQEKETPFRIKIGYSKDPEKRVRTIAGTLPQKIILLKIIEGCLEDEQFFHQHFKPFRVPGTKEWYFPEQEVLDFIELPVAV